MQTILEVIMERRSIRRFTDQPLTEAQMDSLLRCAMQAPSAGNQQPWHFVVIRNRDTLTAIQEIHTYSAMLKEAPAAVLICGETALQRYEGYWVQDCSAAVQNLLLGACGMGLGSVWLGIYPIPERVDGLRRILSIPESVTPFALVALGHPAEKKGFVDRFNPERIHHEKWSAV